MMDPHHTMPGGVRCCELAPEVPRRPATGALPCPVCERPIAEDASETGCHFLRLEAIAANGEELPARIECLELALSRARGQALEAEAEVRLARAPAAAG